MPLGSIVSTSIFISFNRKFQESTSQEEATTLLSELLYKYPIPIEKGMTFFDY